MRLGRIGIWGSLGWYAPDAGEAAEAAAELEELGYGTLWLSGGFGPGVADYFGRLLAATSRMTIASGIISIWHSDPQQVASAVADFNRTDPDRFLLGLGASHAAIVENSGVAYQRPYSKMVEYLDALDAARPTVPPSQRVLAALGPRMLRLSAQRSSGAHPYFVPVEHTRLAREALGQGPVLAPEQGVVLETDPGRAREIAREHVPGYLALPNYANNLRRFGFDDDDLSGAGSDRVVDAVIAWGDLEAIRSRVQAHLDAGADHVCLQVLTGSSAAGGAGFPRREYRELAAALLH